MEIIAMMELCVTEIDPLGNNPSSRIEAVLECEFLSPVWAHSTLLSLSMVTTLIRKGLPSPFRMRPHFPRGADPPPEKHHLLPRPCCRLSAANRSLTSQVPHGSWDLAFICKGGSLGPPLIK